MSAHPPPALTATVLAWLSAWSATAQEAPPAPWELREVEAAPAAGEASRISRSVSKQFVVIGDDGSVRSVFCAFAEQVKGELYDILGLRLPDDDRWRIEILINVSGRTTDLHGRRPVVSDVVVANGAFHLRSRVRLGDTFTREAMREEILSLLLAEMTLRGIDPRDLEAAKRASVPDWLRTGVIESVASRRQDRSGETFAAIYRSGKVLGVSELLAADPGPMDSVSESIYRASCGGLLNALATKHPDGPLRIQSMLADLAHFEGRGIDLIAKHFPGAGDSPTAIEKWWALEMAEMAQPTVKNVLSPAATEEALGACLQRRLLERVTTASSEPSAGPDPDLDESAAESERRRLWQIFRSRKPRETAEGAPSGGPEMPVREEWKTYDLSEYRKFQGRENFGRHLDAIEAALIQLSYRAFPLHRPIIHEYRAIVVQLREGKTKGLDSRFAELAAQRIQIARAAADATDYLHYHLATGTRHLSGAFEDYKAALRELERPPPPRSDPLSQALDALDKEYR